MILVKLTQNDLDIIDTFADLRMGDTDSKNLYKRRGNFSRENIVVGAAAEIACWRLLRKYGYEVGKPDFAIYNVRDKSHNADLSDGYHSFHIKGQPMRHASNHRYGASWLVQKWDRTYTEPENKHYVMMCVVDIDMKAVYVCTCIPARTIVTEELFQEPVIPRLAKEKHALYLETITKQLPSKRFWSILYEDVKDRITNRIL